MTESISILNSQRYHMVTIVKAEHLLHAMFNHLYQFLLIGLQLFSQFNVLAERSVGNAVNSFTIDAFSQVHKGVKGVVVDAVTGEPIANAIVSVNGIDHDIVSQNGGDYFRLLSPGTYSITVKRPL
jgi:NADH/NAD ratio-sensing transcriptional regulator Rex